MLRLKLWQPNLIAEISHGEKTQVGCNSEINRLENLVFGPKPKKDDRAKKRQKNWQTECGNGKEMGSEDSKNQKKGKLDYGEVYKFHTPRF